MPGPVWRSADPFERASPAKPKRSDLGSTRVHPGNGSLEHHRYRDGPRLGAPADHDARPAAIGRVVDGIEAQVLGEDGRPLPPGEVGLVGFRGEGFPTEYVGNPEATGRAFHDGWFYPGDLAAIDADGYFFFKGRADDVISNAGVKFYPIEVERALLAHL